GRDTMRTLITTAQYQVQSSVFRRECVVMIRKIFDALRRSVFAGLLVLSVSLSVSAAEPGSLCTPGSYTVGFFNGVWNTQADALNGLQALRNLIGDRHDGEAVEYTLFYNDTGSEIGQSGRQDLA